MTTAPEKAPTPAPAAIRLHAPVDWPEVHAHSSPAPRHPSCTAASASTVPTCSRRSTAATIAGWETAGTAPRWSETRAAPARAPSTSFVLAASAPCIYAIYASPPARGVTDWRAMVACDACTAGEQPGGLATLVAAANRTAACSDYTARVALNALGDCAGFSCSACRCVRRRTAPRCCSGARATTRCRTASAPPTSRPPGTTPPSPPSSSSSRGSCSSTPCRWSTAALPASRRRQSSPPSPC